MSAQYILALRSCHGDNVLPCFKTIQRTLADVLKADIPLYENCLDESNKRPARGRMMFAWIYSRIYLQNFGNSWQIVAKFLMHILPLEALYIHNY
jgi:hypothetical protein